MAAEQGRSVTGRMRASRPASWTVQRSALLRGSSAIGPAASALDPTKASRDSRQLSTVMNHVGSPS